MAEMTPAHTTLSVPDISCGHCAQTVTNALEPIAGVESVAVDIPNKTVQVTFDPARIDVERMASILADEDYPVAAIQEAGQ
jgi:copper chaperone CopZ